MSVRTDPAVILTDGGPTGLLACTIEGVCRPRGNREAEDSGVAVLMLSPAQHETREWRKAAAQKAAAACHLGDLVELPPSCPAPNLNPVEALTAGLLAAGREAIRRGWSRVVWPVALGGEGKARGGLEAVSEAFDRAGACARLLTLDAGPEGLCIQTPFVDFSDEQLADLAGDLDAPLHCAWFGRPTSPEWDRWERVFHAAGMDVPGALPGGRTVETKPALSPVLSAR
jgi:hypothetical protein